MLKIDDSNKFYTKLTTKNEIVGITREAVVGIRVSGTTAQIFLNGAGVVEITGLNKEDIELFLKEFH